MDPATWDVLSSLGGFAGIAALVTAAGGLRGVKRQLSTSPPESPDHTLADSMDLVVNMVGSLGHQLGEANATHDRELRSIGNRIDHLEARIERLENP